MAKAIKDIYSPLIEKALDSTMTDESRLAMLRGNICVKNDLDILIKNINSAWAPFKVILASILAKLINPEWDTRYHQKQIGGKASLRTVDSHICKILCMKNLYDTDTPGALTRSFEKKEPYNRQYSGSITPDECKNPFLNLVELINLEFDAELLNDMLIYMLSFLKLNQEKIHILQNSTTVSSNELNLGDISSTLDKLHSLGAGSSKLPVIIAFTLISVVKPHLWPSISVLPLKEHTAADSQSHSTGDIEAVDSLSNPKISIEVKHLIAITDSTIVTFHNKTKDKNIPLKFIISTKKTEKRFTESNICIDTVNGFVTNHLHSTLFHDPKICLIFIQELKKQIVNYRNLNSKIRDDANNILTSLLASPSP
jgi:hypothetical protein